MRKPVWRVRLERDLADAGITEDELNEAKREYEAHGINLNVVPRRGWRIFGVGTGNGPTTVICWSSLVTLVKDRPAFIATFKRRAAGLE